MCNNKKSKYVVQTIQDSLVKPKFGTKISIVSHGPGDFNSQILKLFTNKLGESSVSKVIPHNLHTVFMVKHFDLESIQ